jgi:enolase-phosphatase E1
MIRFAGRGILLDIEGTTSSIRYVYDFLFPFAREHIHDFLDRHWDEPSVRQACELIARDAGATSLESWCHGDVSKAAALSKVEREVLRLMDGDVKATGLKELQGLIWREGYEDGRLLSHVYPDVPPALELWHKEGIDLRIYSSGSIEAQRQFFAHTEAGDLLPFFRGHYDTTLGPKREPASYAAIAEDMNLDPASVLFLSDVTAELDAARAAGLAVGLVVRPGNAVPPPQHGHSTINDFSQISLS